jgi:hypothetical protein
MEKYFATYNQSLALKELDFNEPCFGYYLETGEWIPASYSREGTVYPSNSDLLLGWVSAPLKSQVFKWFRDNKHLSHEIQHGYKGFYPVVYKNNNIKNEWSGNIATYEEAELSCIDKLIEIVKQKS